MDDNKKKKEEKEMILIEKKTIYTVISLFLLLGVGSWAYPHMTPTRQQTDTQNPLQTTSLIPAIIESVSADDIGNMFVCPCCGKPITKRCCGLSQERMAYVEAQVDGGLDRDEIVMNMIKKFGLTSMLEEYKEEYKEKLEASAPPERPKISITPTKYNFRDVSVAGGEVHTTMTITNEGTRNLVINKLSTSCGCTTATVEVDGVEGPRFTMAGHGKQPTGWSATISPGGEATLKVYYDPTVHRKMRGKGTRTIDVFSNDPVELTKQVRIDFNQVD